MILMKALEAHKIPRCLSSIESKEKKRKVKSLFPNSSVMDNRGKSQTQQDCVELAKALYSGDILVHFHSLLRKGLELEFHSLRLNCR